MIIVYSIIAAAVLISAFLWVHGIGYMKENHPDYKGEDLFNEEDEGR